MGSISIPFPGSKRHVYPKVKEIIEGRGYKTALEPFGGSCVLSVNLLRDGIVDNVYINDYDKLFDDYETVLDIKDWIVKSCLDYGIEKRYCRGDGVGWYLKRNGKRVLIDGPRLSEDEERYLQGLVSQVEPKYWKVLSYGSTFCYPAVWLREVTPKDFIYFKSGITTTKAREFLSVIRNIGPDSCDWKEFFDKHKNDMDKDSVIILDPPYLEVEQEMYKGCFTRLDTLELLERVKETGSDFIFFNHNPELMKELLNEAGFSDFEMLYCGKKNTTLTHKRKDVMAYVKVNRC